MLQPLDILKQYWGYPAFRPLQAEIIQSVLEGKDTLALMPTGGGKSICFQVPALCQEGVCIVVSPLIALMKDQVYQLKKRGIKAEAIYSGMHRKQIDIIFDNAVYGGIKLLYLSPERLKTDLAIARIARMKVNLLAVDEAHCISQWGYDFRPPYLQIAEIRELLPNVPILALTATATKAVETDIQEKLNFPKPNVFRNSFSRANLAYVVLREEQKEQKLLEMLKNVPGTGIVYVRSRRKTKEIALLLQRRGISADFYHAGLNPEQRSQKQDAWINNKTRIIASTNAFGMGIDKAEVRLVVHLDLPDNLEAYFQEAGRAGRDGKKSYAVILYHESDKLQLKKRFEQSFPDMTQIRQVYRALGSYFQLAAGSNADRSFDFDILEFTRRFKLDVVTTYNCLKILEQAGWISLTEAVYSPSQFQILVNKDQLYDYQLRHPKMDNLLKTILRTTQSAFNFPVRIREKQLAFKLKWSNEMLTQALLKLHKDRIVEYLPSKDKPQIVFLEERVAADNLEIDHAAYQFRKERQALRIKKMIEYVEQVQCRSQLLLSYFDEQNPPRCGICDVCLGRTKANISNEEMKTYATKIQAILQKEPLNLKDLVDSFTPKRRQKVLKVIEFLLDEGILEKEADKLIWK